MFGKFLGISRGGKHNLFNENKGMSHIYLLFFLSNPEAFKTDIAFLFVPKTEQRENLDLILF